ERVVVDLSEVEFIDSTALGVLIEARSRFANRRAFLLAGPGLETRRALEISGLDRHFAVHDSVAEALETTLSPAVAAAVGASAGSARRRSRGEATNAAAARPANSQNAWA